MSVTEIIDTIRSYGLKQIADRITYLHELALNNDDLDGQPINLKSLQAFADYIKKEYATFIIQGDITCPQIGVDGDGYINAEWRHGKSISGIEFLPSGVGNIYG